MIVKRRDKNVQNFLFLFNYGGLMVDKKTELEIFRTKLHRRPGPKWAYIAPVRKIHENKQE